MVKYSNLEEFTFDELKRLVFLAKISGDKKGAIYERQEPMIERLESLGLVESIAQRRLFNEAAGKGFFVITRQGKGLVEEMRDYATQLYNSWKGNDYPPNKVSSEEGK